MTAEGQGGDHHRPVRSFVRRQGRLTRGQRRALDRLGPDWVLPLPDAPLDLDALFGRQAPRVLDIGFGMGEALAEQAAAHPERDYLGVEVYPPGVGRMLQSIEEQGLTNVRLLNEDVMEVLDRALAPASLDYVHLYFPDPWPKKRHHKRRLVQPPFPERVARVLRPGGRLHLATDWAPYAEWMVEVMEAEPAFENETGPGAFAERPGDRPLTRFEQRGERLGHEVFDLLYRRAE
jgi:tRNA (guanine-N7-)-methyltransferase